MRSASGQGTATACRAATLPVWNREQQGPVPCRPQLTAGVTAQSDADYVQQLETFVPALCRNAAPQAPGAAAGGAGKGGGSAAALQALRAHVTLVSRLSLGTRHLDAIESAALANLTTTTPRAAAGSPDAVTSHGEAAALIEDLGDAMQVCQRVRRPPPERVCGFGTSSAGLDNLRLALP